MIYNEIRRKANEIKIGKIAIGQNNPIAIQSMTNTDTRNKEATLTQIKALEFAGCDIVRITVPDIEAVETIPYLKENGVSIPIVAENTSAYSAFPKRGFVPSSPNNEKNFSLSSTEKQTR